MDKKMGKVKSFFKDSFTMFGRCMKLSFRNPETLTMTVVVPVALLFVFTYLFGGAMDMDNFSTTYVNFVFVGIIAMSVSMGGINQSTAVCVDVQKGVLDRFTSLPISRSAFIVGHCLATAVRTLVSVVILFAAGFAMGLQPNADFMHWLGALGIVFLFTIAMSWLGVLCGLLCKTVEGTSGVSFLAQMLVFFSSAFTPTDTMPTALRYFAEYQPITPIIESLRYLLFGTGESRLLEAVLWVVGLAAAGFIFSLIVFKRRMRK